MEIKNKKSKYKKGFTLIELMVATSIFVIIMLSSMGALFMLIDSSKNSRALRSAMDNVNFSMESMTRSIRMGTNYYCVPTNGSMPDPELTNDCVNGGTFLAFIPQDSSSRVAFALQNTKYDVNGMPTHSSLQRCESVNGSTECVDIVSPEVNIEKLKFFVKGSSNIDNLQPSVYIIMKGTVTIKGIPTSFAIQTMASQRNF